MEVNRLKLLVFFFVLLHTLSLCRGCFESSIGCVCRHAIALVLSSQCKSVVQHNLPIEELTVMEDSLCDDEW